MTFTKVLNSNPDLGSRRNETPRPRFNSLVTSDRLREGSRLPKFSMASSIRKGRRSIFKEVGLTAEGRESQQNITSETHEESDANERIGPSSEIASPVETTSSIGQGSPRGKSKWLSKLAPSRRPRMKTTSSAPPPMITGLHRLSMIALLIAIVLPTISYNNGHKRVEVSGADAGVIRPNPSVILKTREDSPTDVCTRWAGQSKCLSDVFDLFIPQPLTSLRCFD